MKRILNIVLVAVAAFLFSSDAYSQAAIPFEAGETLTYEGKVSKIIPGIAVADLTLSVDRVEGDQDFLIIAEARSKGTLLKLFRFSFLQRLESTVDDAD